MNNILTNTSLEI